MAGEDTKSYTESTKYNDPEADIIITTEDNGRLRVHSYILKANSSVFRDMLSNPALSPSASEDNSPIHLDTTLKVIEVLLDLCTKPDRGEKPEWTEMLKAFELCGKYDFAMAASRIKSDSRRYLKTDPWEVFVFASHQDLFDLAKEAISFFGGDAVRDDLTSNDLGDGRLALVSPAYVFALGAAMGDRFDWQSDYRAERYREAATRFRLL